MDEDSESIKDGKNKQDQKLFRIKEKLAEERKPRSSKFRVFQKMENNGKYLLWLNKKKDI